MPVDPVKWLRVIRRVLTSAGNTVNLSVSATATSVTWNFPRTEIDTSYGVAISPSWLTTAAITTKTTTSLTASFGTAAPSGATIDISTFRTE